MIGMRAPPYVGEGCLQKIAVLFHPSAASAHEQSGSEQHGHEIQKLHACGSDKKDQMAEKGKGDDHAPGHGGEQRGAVHIQRPRHIQKRQETDAAGSQGGHGTAQSHGPAEVLHDHEKACAECHTDSAGQGVGKDCSKEVPPDPFGIRFHGKEETRDADGEGGNDGQLNRLEGIGGGQEDQKDVWRSGGNC